MELDGYCTELSVAFEHQGIQHYEYTPFFQSRLKFLRALELDSEKRALCEESKVLLIEVRWDCPDILEFIKGHLPCGGV